MIRSHSLVARANVADSSVMESPGVSDEIQRATSSQRVLDDYDDKKDHADYEGGESLPRRARVGYLVMASGVEEMQKTKRLLKVTANLSTIDFASRIRYLRISWVLWRL